jgi:two-component system, LytTR family, response regulator
MAFRFASDDVTVLPIGATNGHRFHGGSAGPQGPAKLRVVIVEDEPLARDRLRQLLAAEPEVELVGTWENGKQAIEAMQATLPDVIFLDVQMPEMDGFAFLETLPPAASPMIIIVTGHEKHATKAFDVHAVDFLLKPFNQERFRLTLQRARERIQRRDRPRIDNVVGALRRILDSPRSAVERIAIKANGRIAFVTTAEIDWINTVGNYCEIHAGGTSHMLLSTLSALEARLPAENFVRISRSTIINMLRLKELRFGRSGSTVRLQDGTELSVTESYRKKLAERAGT